MHASLIHFKGDLLFRQWVTIGAVCLTHAEKCILPLNFKETLL